MPSRLNKSFILSETVYANPVLFLECYIEIESAYVSEACTLTNISVANLGYHIICVNVENLKMINEIVKIIVK